MTEWQDISSAPATGSFLVYLERPLTGSRVQVMSRRTNITTVASIFSFDAPKATHWMPLPPPPSLPERGED